MENNRDNKSFEITPYKGVVLVPPLPDKLAQEVSAKLRNKDYGTYNIDLARNVLCSWLVGKNVKKEYLDQTFFPGTSTTLSQIMNPEGFSVPVQNDLENALRRPLMEIFTIRESIEHNNPHIPDQEKSTFESYGQVWLDYKLQQSATEPQDQT